MIGLTGSFGSGCTYVAKEIIAKNGYVRISLSDILKSHYWKQNDLPAGTKIPRRKLQEFGDEKRRAKGNAWLAEEAVSQMDRQSENGSQWVVDSIRNPGEVRELRGCTHNFFLFGIYADKEIRWERVRETYEGNRQAFDDDDEKDTGRDSPVHGQRVGDCFSEADVVLANERYVAVPGNDTFQSLKGKTEQYLQLAANPLHSQQPIKEEEALMAMAYAASQRSSCLKRKVGAVIVDDLGNVVSSGYNEVPLYEKPCVNMYLQCHRDLLREDFLKALKEGGMLASEHADAFRDEFRSHFRILDYCRALHAEENAILNLCRNGRSVPLSQCTLYTTTYPCRLCANKIVNTGIGRVVYLEPYPDAEAKVILGTAGVRDEFFEGVTFKAYFRLYGEEK